jgi:hypothetical protein
MLDTIHSLRLALGAFRTLPGESPYAETEEPSIFLCQNSFLFNMQLEYHQNFNGKNRARIF